MRYVYISILTITIVGCSPLRKVQSYERVDSTYIDNTKTEVRDTVTKVVNQTVVQTIVEYYPIIDTVYIDRPIRQPVKSVTTTHIDTKTEELTGRDSIVRNDIVIATDRESETKSEEEPPATTQTIKWIAISLLAILLILIIIKLW